MTLVETLFADLKVVDAEAWRRAWRAWLGGLAPATQRVYRASWGMLINFAGLNPWEVQSGHVLDWMESLRVGGLSERSIQLRVASISSFYCFVSRQYVVEGEEGERPLHVYNPAAVRRPRKVGGRESVFLTGEQVRVLLGSIGRRGGAQGARDLALFTFFIATGRRCSEVLRLKWSDFRGGSESTPVQYRWKGKGKGGWDEVPGDVWGLLEAWRARSTGLGSSEERRTAEGYVFTSLRRGEEGKVLSGGWVNRLLRGYARRAGLDAGGLRVHSLRHTHSMLLRGLDVPVVRIQERLGHSSPSTTAVYLHELEGGRNPEWVRVREHFGIGEA